MRARRRILRSLERRGGFPQAGVEVHLDASGDALAARAGTLIKSPGVPANAPVVAAARARGMPVLGELELAWRLVPNEFVAVTGTNGKTTTTEWIGHIHREAALPVAVVGNVGTPATSLAGRLASTATVVCEASSFQLEDTEAFAPEAAVLLNLEPDHLDRHGSFDELRRGEAADLRQPGQRRRRGGRRRPGARGPRRLCAAACGSGPATTRPLSLRDGELAGGRSRCCASARSRCPGAHNRANAMAAAAVCLARGIDADAVAAGCETFAGVAHRLELIAVRDGVAYVNDSKATNVASTLVALRSYAGGVHLIAGGRGKQQDFSPLAPLVAAALRGRVPDRRGGRGASRRRWRRRASQIRRCGVAGARAAAPPPPPRDRATRCCSRRPARAMTSTRTSKRAEITSARSWRRSDGARRPSRRGRRRSSTGS